MTSGEMERLAADYRERYAEVWDRVKAVCGRTGRDPSSVDVVAVSKTQPLEAIEAAYEAGIRDFGENRAQEMSEKAEMARAGINWHFVGHLQTNKVKLVVGKAVLIHSVDSERLAGAVNREAVKRGLMQQVLLQVNVSGESTKSGFAAKELPGALLNIREMKALDVRGLMTIAPFTDEEEEARKTFKGLRELRDALNDTRRLPRLELLSMGMTNDFEIAVEEGANMLRIGTAIFGARG